MSEDKKKDIHGGNIWKESKRLKVAPSEILDFSASINPVFPHKKISDIINFNISSIYSYPDPEYDALKKSLSSYLAVDKKNLVPSNGSSELIYSISRLIKAKSALIVTPTFSEYEKSLNLVGCKIDFFSTSYEDSFNVLLDNLSDRLKSVEMLFICNPNNPTGKVLSKSKIELIVNMCAENQVFLVLDEAFIEFLDKPIDCSFARDSCNYDNVIVLRSLTKMFSIAGLRIGYAVGNSTLIEKLKGIIPPWSVNTLASFVAQGLLKDVGFVEDSKALIKIEREFLYLGLKKIKHIYPFNSSVNYILCRIENKKIQSNYLYNELADLGILIRDCQTMRGLDDSFFRIAVKNRKDNGRLLFELGRIINELG